MEESRSRLRPASNSPDEITSGPARLTAGSVFFKLPEILLLLEVLKIPEALEILEIIEILEINPDYLD